MSYPVMLCRCIDCFVVCMGDLPFSWGSPVCVSMLSVVVKEKKMDAMEEVIACSMVHYLFLPPTKEDSRIPIFPVKGIRGSKISGTSKESGRP